MNHGLDGFACLQGKTFDRFASYIGGGMLNYSLGYLKDEIDYFLLGLLISHKCRRWYSES